jgi:hypothetical protein
MTGTSPVMTIPGCGALTPLTDFADPDRFGPRPGITKSAQNMLAFVMSMSVPTAIPFVLLQRHLVVGA